MGGGFQGKFQAALAASKESWALEDSSQLGLSRMYRYDSDDFDQEGNLRSDLLL
jgi:hypothetical protein